MSKNKQNNTLTLRDELTEFLLYTSPNGHIKVEVLLLNETIWLPQNRIAELFDTSKQNVGQHLKNIFQNGELEENSVVKDFFTTAADNKKYNTKYYNLDVVISLGTG